MVNCAQKDWHNHIKQTQIHTDIGDQYSATINVHDRPSRVRTCLICKIDSHEYSRKFDVVLFIVKLTHSRRNLRSICLMASRRKPAPPVVYARCLVCQRIEELWSVVEGNIPVKPIQTSCACLPGHRGAESRPTTCVKCG